MEQSIAGSASFIDSNSIEVVVFGWVLTVLITVVGWSIERTKSRTAAKTSAKLQRQLQRKSVAVTLLNDNRFQPPWVDGLRAVFAHIRANLNYDWVGLAQRRFGNGELTPDELELYDHLKTVLNYLEFTAVVILNRAADENIVRWSYGFYYQELNAKLHQFFPEARRIANDPSIWCNFTKLADRWDKDPDIAQPTD